MMVMLIIADPTTLWTFVYCLKYLYVTNMQFWPIDWSTGVFETISYMMWFGMAVAWVLYLVIWNMIDSFRTQQDGNK